MADQGPTAPISKYVLVRSPRPIDGDTKTLISIRRPDNDTAFWKTLRDSPSISETQQAANEYVKANELQTLFSRPFDKFTQELWNELYSAYRSVGITALNEVISRRQLLDVNSEENKARTFAFELALWDGIAARLVLRSPALDICDLFAALRILHLLRFRPSEIVSANQLFTALPALPLLLTTTIRKPFEEEVAKINEALISAEDAFTKTRKVRFSAMILRQAAVYAIATSVKNHDLVAKDAPNIVVQAGAGDLTQKATVTRSQFRLVLSDHALRQFNQPLLAFLRTVYSVDDLSAIDATKLLSTLSDDLSKDKASAFGALPQRLALEASNQISLLARETLAGDFETLDAKLESIANRFPLGQSLYPTPARSSFSPSHIRPAGIADLKIVNQQLQRYQLGEVAYIENVLAGEERERTHNRLERTEQQLITETEDTSTTERDLQTTERFELSQELDAMQKETRSNESGVSVSASYGEVTISADTKAQSTEAAESAIKNARNYTKETVSRALERVQRRTRRQQTTTLTSETSEINRHKFTAGKTPTVGIYRYVEKSYWCQTLNYGARLMMEFLVPEPAVYYLFSQATPHQPAPAGLSPPDPIPCTALDITEENFAALAKKYGAQVSDPPKLFSYSHVLYQGKAGTTEKVTIDAGYLVTGLYAVPFFIYTSGQPRQPALTLLFGAERWDSDDYWPTYANISPGFAGEFSMTVIPFYISGEYTVGVTLVLTRTDELFQKWQLETFNAITAAYKQAKDEYDRALSSSTGGNKRNQVKTDTDYRSIEQIELKRSCLEILTNQHFDTVGAIKPVNDVPTIDVAAALAQGPTAQFFEEAFEWNQMTYLFYPYFWGRKTQWLDLLATSDADPVFQKFLRAGFARVNVPVRRNFENDLAYFLNTGDIWGVTHPGEAPSTEDQDFVPIIQELREIDSALERGGGDGVPEGAPWQIAVPTALVCLDVDSVKLPSWQLEPAGAIPYSPSLDLCDGVPYNAAQWTDAKRCASGLKDLGYKLPDSQDYVAFFASSLGRRFVVAFQRRANQLGASALLGRPLKLDGVLGPCTLRTLSAMTEKLRRGDWPGPDSM